MMLPQQAQIIVLNPSAKRESGRKAQLANIHAAKVSCWLTLGDS